MGGRHGFGWDLGHGNIVRPEVGIQYTRQQQDPLIELRKQYLQLQMAGEQRKQAEYDRSMAAAAVASYAAEPQMREYSIGLPGEWQAGRPGEEPQPVSGFGQTVTALAPKSYEEMVSSLPPGLDPMTRSMATDVLRQFAKPGVEAQVPREVQEARQSSALMAQRPDLSMQEARAAATTGYVPPVLSPEQKEKQAARKTVLEAIQNKAIIDPKTGASADPKTVSGALTIASYAAQHGATDLEQAYTNIATRVKAMEEEGVRQRAAEQAPQLIGQLRRFIGQGKLDATQQAQAQTAIAALEADPVHGIAQAQTMLGQLAREQEQERRDDQREKLADQRAKRAANPPLGEKAMHWTNAQGQPPSPLLSLQDAVQQGYRPYQGKIPPEITTRQTLAALDQVLGYLPTLKSKHLLMSGPGMGSYLSTQFQRQVWQRGDPDLDAFISHTSTLIRTARELGDIGFRAKVAIEGTTNLVEQSKTAEGIDKALHQLRNLVEMAVPSTRERKLRGYDTQRKKYVDVTLAPGETLDNVPSHIDFAR